MVDLQRLREYYGDLSDHALVHAYSQGASSYDPAAWAIVAAEVERRGLGEVAKEVAAIVAAQIRTASDETAPAELSPDEVQVAIARARTQSGLAFWWLVGGAVVTVGSWVAASDSEGTYVIAWGAIAFGLLRLLQAESRIKALTKHTSRRSISERE